METPVELDNAVLTALRTVEARGWYLEACGPAAGMHAVRASYGGVRALALGTLLAAIARREQDFFDAAEAAASAGARFGGYADGRGWTALTAGEGALVFAPSLPAFVLLLSQCRGQAQTSVATSAVPDDAEALREDLEEQLSLAQWYLAPALSHLGDDARAPPLTPAAQGLSAVLADAGERLGGLLTPVDSAEAPAMARRVSDARGHVLAASVRFSAFRKTPTLAVLAAVIARLHAAAVALASDASGEFLPVDTFAVPVLRQLLEVAKTLRHLVEAAYSPHQAHPEGASDGRI